MTYVAAHNEVSMPFTWTKDTDEILRKVHKISRQAVTALLVRAWSSKSAT